MEQKYIMALEIGSSKIKGAIGIVDQFEALKVLTIEEESLIDSVRYGCIQNVDDVRAHIIHIIEKLESNNAIAPRKLEGAYVALGGRSLMASTCKIEYQLQEGKEISEQDIEIIKQEAHDSNRSGNDVIDVIPQDFIVDNITIQNPIGTVGQTMHATFNLITCKPQIKKNLSYVFDDHLQLNILDFIVRPIAQATLVLTEDDRSLGCMLVDFGAETTTVSIYKGEKLRYLTTLPIGSRNITRDLTTLNMTEARAENIKLRIGNANPQESNIETKSSEDDIDYTDVNNFVQTRTEEIIANIIEQINYAKYKTTDLPSGIIVVGGGAKLKGFNSLLENQSKMNVRNGVIPEEINIDNVRIENPNEIIDVVSILFAATKLPDVAECLREQVHSSEEEKVLEPFENDTNLEDKDEQQNQKTKPSFIAQLTKRIKGYTDDLFNDDEDD